MDVTTALTTCSRCGAPRDAAALGGLCPHCVALDFFTPAPAAGAAASSPLLDESERRLGDYELREEIARGGMGVVYRARQISLDREVAVKMILQGVLAGDRTIARLKAEATAAAALRHPNIVAVFETGEHQGRHFFSMEFVKGRTLAEAVREGPLPARSAAIYLRAVAEAVHYAHERGILHRDLKPSNVLLDEHDQPRVTDFGLAKSVAGDSDLTLTGEVVGTPAYMSPEQAGGAKFGAVDARSDVYSLGALLYHLLTGRAPFTGAAATEILRQVTDTDPVAPRLLNPALPRDLETICLKCLAKDAPRRYPSAQALADDLGRFLQGEPIFARPATAAEKFWLWGRRKPALAASLAAIALLMTTITVGSLVSAHRLERARRESEHRLHDGERLLEFMLGDLGDRLESVGRLDVMEATFAEVERFYANVPVAQQSPASLRFRAQGFSRFGDLRADEGKMREAETNYLKAIAWFRRAEEADPQNDSGRYASAGAWNSLGIVYAREADFPRAGKAFGECYGIRKKLVAAQPDNPLWLHGYAAVAQNLTQFSRHSGDLPKALDYIRDAIEAYRHWYQLAPTNAQARAGFGISEGTASQLYQEIQRWDEAEQAAREGVRIFREGLQTDPRNARFAAGLAQVLSFLGQVQMTNGQSSAAVETLTKGARLAEDAVQRDADNRESKMLLCSVLVLRGAAFEQLGETTKALADWQRVIAVSEAEPEKARQFAEWRGYWRGALEHSIAAQERLLREAHSAGDAAATEREAVLTRWRQQLSALEAQQPEPLPK